DYVMKSKLTRLPMAVERALRDAAERDARRKAEESLRLLEKAVETMPVGVTICDTEGRIVFVNPAGAGMHGYPPQELIGKDARIFSPDGIQAEMSPEAMRTMTTWTRERVNVGKDGRRLPVQLISSVVNDQRDEPAALVTVCEDITFRKEAEERLRHDAFYDALTNLPNRALFHNHLERAIARTLRTPERRFAVLFLDLDRFKYVNDSLGHLVGDELLVAISRRLEECLRPGDSVARLGGDEFAILLDDVDDVGTATEVADRVLQRLDVPFFLEEQEVFTSASIGIAWGAPGAKTADELLRDADTAMYHAKSLGKGRYQVFDGAMHSRAVTTLKLGNDLRRAVERREFEVFYQPLVSLGTGRVVAFEALVRWRHPDRGVIYPTDFIPMAEETGLIVPLGRFVLEEACRRRRAWGEAFQAPASLVVTVNLSARELAQAGFLDHVDRILRETGVDARTLGLEITESAIMESAETATKLLECLKARRIRLHIDDFGTGYSSLSYLHRFPVDTLKIDRSFVARLGNRDPNVEIVRTIVTLAHSLGMEVMAEGVETREQLEELRALECDSAQGFYFAPALSGEDASALLERRPRW
ncbi:MAG TPA: EAL domain-containing protein, partial [Thermoanaerobaculia bacterium]|nr:EAL domain-containing protein [Thermoanaerobaculia bacterium]